MITEDQRKHKLHLARIIGYAFIGAAVAYLGSMLFPPDTSIDPPVIPPIMMTLGMISTALYILGCTAFSIKLTEDKKTMASIGFAMMAIAQGVTYVIFTFTINSHEKMDEVYRMFSACLFLEVPSMIMIAAYSNFPRWVNISGVASMVPYILEYVAFRITGHLSFWILVVDGIANVLFYLVAISWGVMILKNVKKELAISPD